MYRIHARRSGARMILLTKLPVPLLVAVTRMLTNTESEFHFSPQGGAGIWPTAHVALGVGKHLQYHLRS